MNKKLTKFLMIVATVLITVAQTLVSTNACTSMAHETEIPECLEW